MTIPSHPDRFRLIGSQLPDRLSPTKPVSGDLETMPYLPPTGTGVPEKMPPAIQMGFPGERGSHPTSMFSQHNLEAMDTPPIYILYHSSGLDSDQVFRVARSM